ncbi:molybdate ABC transporter substrate-binding protein [Zymomonas mobilis]|uniref:Molybdenum ABC transporter, periplasmic molybdate-binding protein n=1 Tax=Zymomonas mobilis subsp. pomaceae (strain ATCC 29192 / DSM 22645 / JCM 10191 / CCUG 17912 / NBRC 13757 / NCIMB 11200 / NRRL B-4491 / Barker I) TaxID=579138 RepID=F8EUP1_ZYMMT|nr:molybdate ABC transporter substrate-binding protein [Zymomonas mobilis]AEI38187.1 molybdenum ABC transporter, periplasmic molybdate-binding protein [Zymomonas mobilis subsp. pomaceae ATCC 29192]MDX5947877.1 molybdate ABC transporter substrate-binding protein [Zymomonas mobilis subsp. pomaceae]GEB89959.1 ABC transporter substrate-binding protein [Zymomonas mobilis subsp. pomaceae]
MKPTLSLIAITLIGCAFTVRANAAPVTPAPQQDITAFSQPMPTLQVWAAGSLRGALTDIAQQFSSKTGIKIETSFGPAGLLFSRIKKNEAVDVYLSANMRYPQQLSDEKIAAPPVIFTHNTLCLTTRAGFDLTADNMVDVLLRPSVKIGTSTPGNDPGGDYAMAFFAKIGESNTSSQDILQKKARPIVGGKFSPSVPLGWNPVEYFLASQKIDVFIGYCSAHNKTTDPRFTKTRIPDTLAAPIVYGSSVLLKSKDPNQRAAAFQFAFYLMSEEAKKNLRAYHFEP